MNIGTKSILFGIHQFAFHPFMVARGWYRLYGFRRVEIGSRTLFDRPREGGIARARRRRVFASLWRPALWISFIVHDLGYLGKPNMDGAEGELHPELGAKIMRRLFGEPWGDFVLLHSRFIAKQRGRRPSPLCLADKLAIVVTPRWLYLRLAMLTGEIGEYMAKSARNNETGQKYAAAGMYDGDDLIEWHRDMINYVTRWVEEHKDGREDTWTGRVAAEVLNA